MATLRLFHEDAYRTRFTARVLVCRPAGDYWDVALDRTCFYAESGGQPSDGGTLGGLPVLAVREDEASGEILHTVGALLEGEVAGEVDWARRLDHMEQHTGQHLLSGAFEQLLGAETASWHLGSESCTIDLTIDALTPEQVAEIEWECNRRIREGLPVITHVVDDAGVTRLPLRKPPAVTGEIRVVEIGGYDWSACAGTHVRSIAELNLVKIKSWEKNKRFTRVEFLAGSRALTDYMSLDRMTRELGRSLSIAVGDLPAWVARQQDEASGLRKQLKVAQERLLEIEALELLAAARKVAGISVVRMVFGGRPLEEIKLLAAKVAAHPGSMAVFGLRSALPQIVLQRSPDIRLDVGAIVRQVLPLIDGRGGGSPMQAQGGGTRPDGLEPALDAAIARLGELLHQGL